MPGRPFEESTMNGDRALTIHFLDGTHVSFGFPAQKANDAARSMMLDEVLEKPYLLIEADGAHHVSDDGDQVDSALGLERSEPGHARQGHRSRRQRH
jgi:very-short-patch-repair endonuclease